MKGLLKYALVLLVALGSASAPAAFWQWSKTAATNNNIDPSINWTAGMSPSGIDPSGRAMMARIAEWRDDISGSITTGGTSTSYTFSSKELAGGNGLCGSSVIPEGTMIALTPHVTSGFQPAITVDGCIGNIASSLLIFAPPGTLVAGTPYRLRFTATGGNWVLVDFYGNPYGIPLGGVMPTTINSVPNSNFILPAGQCISTTTYAAYWALLGSPAPGGCGAGTFAVIDMRGRVPIASDNLNGTFAGRLSSAAAGCGVVFNTIGNQCGNQSQTLTLAQLPTGIVIANGSQAITTTGPTNIPIYNGGSAAIQAASSAGTGLFSPAGSQATGNNFVFSGSNALSMTSNNTSGSAHPNVQPTIAVSYLLRVI